MGAGRGYALPRRGQRDMGEPMVPPGPSGHPSPSFGALPVGQAAPALLRRAPRGRSCFRNHATPRAVLKRGLLLGTASCRFDCDPPRRRAAVRLGVRGRGGAPHAKIRPRPPFGGRERVGIPKGVRENRRFAHPPFAPAARSRKTLSRARSAIPPRRQVRQKAPLNRGAFFMSGGCSN